METKQRRIVIIGGVAAGATAAARVRRLDERATITIVERGPYVSFANCGLPYHLSGAIDKRSKLILQTPEGFLSRYRVEVRLKTEAVAIDRSARSVRLRDLASGSESDVPYDALILAQGGSPFVPPLPGADLPHVFKLWTIPDMDAIQARLKAGAAGAAGAPAPKSAVVVGGGAIGLETAEAFAERGLAVTVVELADRVLPMMDPIFGEAVKRRFTAAGVRVLTGRSVKRILPDSVELDDGSTAPAELVLLSIGVRPNVELAKAAGLELGASGALKVDAYLRASDPWIWAAGDMTETVSRVTGAAARVPLAGPANRQGRLAAGNALAALAEAGIGPADLPPPQAYRGAAGSFAVKIFDMTAAMTGLSLAAARKAGFDAAEATVLKGDHASYYPGAADLLLRLVYDRKDGRLLGAEAWGAAGADKRVDVAAVAVQARLGIDDLAGFDFAYAPPYSSANDPLNMAAYVAQNDRSGYAPLISAEAAAGEAGAAGETAAAGEAGALLVDLRTMGEYARGRAAGALSLPLDELRDRFGELPKSRPLRLVSKGGFESHLGLRILRQAGFTDVRNVSGGWAALSLMPGIAIES